MFFNNQERPASLLFLTAYAFFVSVLYHFSYWVNFGINIFQYISPSELLLGALYPLVLGVAPFFIGASANLLDKERLKEGEGRHTKLGVILNRHVRLLSIAYITLSTLPLLTKSDVRFFVSAAMFSIFLVSVASRFRIGFNFINNDKLRYFSRFTVIALPFLAISVGVTNAENILKNREYKIIRFQQYGDVYKYIGTAGGYYFAAPNDNSIVVINKPGENQLIQISATSRRQTQD